MKKRAVIFDLDGTLLDSYAEALRRTEKIALMLGLPFDQRILDKIKSLWGRPAPEMIKACWPDTDIQAFWVAWGALDSIRPYRLFPGTRKMLQELRRRKIIIGLLTQRGASTSTQLEKNKIKSFFAFVHSTSGSSYAKPHPKSVEPCFENLARLRIRPAQTLFVGDSVRNDWGLARAVGIDFVGVLTGNNTREDFMQAGLVQDRILASVANLPRLLT